MRPTIRLSLVSAMALTLFAGVRLAPLAAAQSSSTKLGAFAPAEVDAHAEFAGALSIEGSAVLVGAEAHQNGRGCAFLFLRTFFQWNEGEQLIGRDSAKGDHFGASVCISGGRCLVGAPHDDDGGDSSGSAYVFELTAKGPIQVAKLTASDAAAKDRFGLQVQLVGSTAFVSAPYDDDLGTDSGAVYVFERAPNGLWTEVQKLVGVGDGVDSEFGFAISANADRLFVGAPSTRTHNVLRPGTVHVFERLGGSWQESTQLAPTPTLPYARFGASLSYDGLRVAVGSPGDWVGADIRTGAAYVFAPSGSSWVVESKLRESQSGRNRQFGFSVSLSGDSLVAASHPHETVAKLIPGAAYLIERDPSGVWLERQGLGEGAVTPDELFGRSTAIEGCHVLVGSPGATLDLDEEGAMSAYLLHHDSESFCFGDGPGTSPCSSCPCANQAPAGTAAGCLNSAGSSARLIRCGSGSLSAASLSFAVFGSVPRAFSLLVSGEDRMPSSPAHPCFGLSSGMATGTSDGLTCVGGALRRHGIRSADSNGALGATSPGWGGSASNVTSAFAAGQSRHFQVLYREPLSAMCGTGVNSTNGATVEFVP